MLVRANDVQALARLWRALDAYPPSRPDEALHRCFSELASLLGASNVFWVGAVRDEAGDDPSRGWRPRAYFFWQARAPHVLALTDEIVARIAQGEPDVMTAALVAGAGELRAHLRSEIVSDEEWERSWLYSRILKPANVSDRLVGAHPLDAYHESYIGADRGSGEPRFKARERDLLYLFLAGSRRLHDMLMMGNGLFVRGVVFTAREREMLRLLLTDLSEKEIAAELGLTWRSAHQLVGAVLRKAGVSGRLGLIARWLHPLAADAG